MTDKMFEAILYELYEVYCNPATCYFRDPNGYEVWKQLRETYGYDWIDV